MIDLVRIVLTLAVVCTVACSSGDSPAAPPGEQRLPIQGGLSDASLGSSVGVCIGKRGQCEGLCSGVLIARNLVVTARHCIDEAPAKVDCATSRFGQQLAAASSFSVTTNPSMNQSDVGWHGVASILRTSSGDLCGNDLALLLLTESVSSSEAIPAAPARAAPPRVCGGPASCRAPVTAIGYGLEAPARAAEAPAGLRRALSGVSIVCVSGSDDAAPDCAANDGGAAAWGTHGEFVTAGGACTGDSGSGVFETPSLTGATPVVLGVLSRGSTGESDGGARCIQNVYTRLDMWHEFLAEGARAAAALSHDAPPNWVAGGADAGQEEPCVQGDLATCASAGADLQSWNSAGCAVTTHPPSGSAPTAALALTVFFLIRQRGRARRAETEGRLG